MASFAGGFAQAGKGFGKILKPTWVPALVPDPHKQEVFAVQPGQNTSQRAVLASQIRVGGKEAANPHVLGQDGPIELFVPASAKQILNRRY